MATIRRYRGKLKTSWRAEVWCNGVRESATFHSKIEAEVWARDREVGLSRGVYLSTHTLADAMRKYSREVSPTKGGKRWEQIRLAALEAMGCAHKRLSEVSPDDIAQHRDARLKAVSGATVNRELNLLSAVFETARREWRWCQHNPVRDIRRPKNPQHRERLITDSERDAIVARLGYRGGRPENKSQCVAAAFLVALETAMRAGEIVGLTKDRIHIRQSYVRLATTKNGTARNVPLSERAKELLEYAPFDLASGTLDALFRKARDAEGLDCTFHDTRHTAITRMAKKLHVLDLARAVGIRNPKTLMVYYNATASDIAKLL